MRDEYILKVFLFFKLGFTPCKGKQPPQGIDLREENKHKKTEAHRKFLKKEPTINRCLLILDLKPFR